MDDRTVFNIQQTMLILLEAMRKMHDNIDSMQRQQQSMRDTLDSIRGLLKDDNRGKYKPKVHTQKRAQMLLLSDYVIPEWDQDALDWVQRTDKGEHGIFKWVGTNVDDIESLDNKRQIVMPKLFPVFLSRFLKIPQNCCWHRMGQRLYYCCSEQDKWQTFDNGVPEYWNFVRNFLWHCYGEWWEKLASKDDSCYVHEIKETVTNKTKSEIPLNVYGLKNILYMPQPHGHGSILLGNFLQKAFLSRNTNRKY